MRQRIMFLLLLCLWPVLALGQKESARGGLDKMRYGNGLYKALQGCSAQETLVESYDCFMAYGYISGVRDNDANILVPADTTWQQAFEIVETYLAKHPERRQLASVVLIRTAFREAGWWKG